MTAVEILLILVGVAWLGFGIWVWIDSRSLRRNQVYDDAPGSLPTLQIVAAWGTMAIVFVVLALVVRRLLTAL